MTPASASTLIAMLHSAAHERSGEVCLVEANRSWTPMQLLQRAEAVAACLQACGVQAGDRVVIRGRNSGDFVARIFGVWAVGGVAVPMHTHPGRNRFAQITVDAMPAAYIADEHLDESASADALPPYTAVVLSSHDSRSLAVSRTRSTFPEGPENWESAALLMYTSGSTAVPLGVICPEASVRFAVEAIAGQLGYGERDRVLCALPLAFDYGLYQVFLAIASGAVLILADGADKPYRIPRLLAEHDISVFPGIPSMFGPLLRAGWLAEAGRAHLRMLTSTGEFFSPALVDALRRSLPGARVVPMYGLTECKRVSIQGPGVPDTARYSVGRALPGTEAWVGDGQGQPKPSGQEGELYVRGPHLMAGYWRNDAATAARYKTIDGQRTIQTGDIFQMDEAGYLTFVRRDGGFLKAKGQRLSPAEIEECLILIPEIREAVAVGYTNMDGEDSIAVFVTGEAIDQTCIRRHCARHLPHAAVPSLIRLLDDTLPRGPNGKYDRLALVALAQELGSRRGSS